MRFQPLCAAVLLLLLDGARARRDGLADCRPIALRHGRVRYRKNGFAQAHCAAGYLLAGDRYVKCTAARWEGALPVCVRATCRPPSPPAHGFVYPSHRGAVLNFYCAPAHTLVGPATAFCDGARWSAHLPVCAAGAANLSIACDFETSAICGWTHDLNHDFDWTRNAHATPSAFLGTGPLHDHTLGARGVPAGHYMYVEASARNAHDVARLVSPPHAPATPAAHCLAFWYHMYGATSGTLRVYVRRVPSPDDSSAPWDFDAASSVWSASGNKGNRWLRAVAPLGRLADAFQVIIEGVRGSNYLSDMAIDDVELIAPCGEEEAREALEVATEEEPATESSEASPPVGGSTDSDAPFTAFSCYNRCGSEGRGDACGCADACSDEHRCCFDYEAWCLDTDNATSTPWTEGTEGATSTPTIVSTPTTIDLDEGVATTQAEQATATPTTRPPMRWLPITDVKHFTYDVEEREEEEEVERVTPTRRESEGDTVAALAGAGALVACAALVVAAAGVRRRWWCARMRDRRWGGSTSQSDVRFLSGDEILDLNLPY